VKIVLAAIQADACAKPILSTATALADLFDANLAALHVRENDSSSPGELAAAFGAAVREVSGSPIEQIIAAAADREVAALALGARGVHGGPQPAGHTALEVITRVRKPVPLEGTRDSSQALQDTIRLAHRRQLEILVLHVHTPATVPAFANHEPHATAAWEHEFLTRHIPTPHDRVSLQRQLGLPADDTIAVAHEHSADLIVLAWSQNLEPGHAHVVSQTLAHSDIPVLLIPTT